MVSSGTRRTRSTCVLATLLPVLVMVGACTADEPGTEGDGGDGQDLSVESSPFTVGPVPDGYQAVTAGRGMTGPSWGSDIGGTDEPFTVASPDGTVSGDDVVVVALTGFAGQQGGLAQSSTGYWQDVEEIEVGGRDAVFAPAGGDRWADLVVEQGEDLAVRVASPAATLDELVDVLDHVVLPDDRSVAPGLDHPDLEVVGSVDVPAVVAGHAAVINSSFPDGARSPVPGSPAAHGAGWRRADQDLVVLTIPGRTVDLPALAAHGWQPFPDPGTETNERTIDGRRAVVEERGPDEAGTIARTVWLEAPWGDVVVVRATGGSPPSVEELLALAASVERTDKATWDAFVAEVGGPQLSADAGQEEITRGTVDGVGWLLQTGLPPVVAGAPSGRAAATCLLVTVGGDRCADGRGVGPPGTVWAVTDTTDPDAALDDPLVPPFVIVTTDQPGAAVRADTGSEVTTVPLLAIPGSDLRAAVVFLDRPVEPRCPVPTSPTGDGPMALEIVDADGDIVACIG